MSEAVELAPCPFCGGPAEIWRATPGTTRKAWIACVGRCVVISKEHETDAEAIAAWNLRAKPEGEPVAQDAKDAEITRLRADIAGLEDGNMTFLCDQLDKAKAENAAQAVELERMRDLVGDLDRRAKACEGLKPKAHDGPSHHRLGGKAQAYAHAADLARQALKAG